MSEAEPQSWPRITRPPRLLASTGSTYSTSIAESHVNERALQEHPSNHTPPPARPPHLAGESNLFKSLAWTPDGTTLLTHSEDHGLRTFILPPTLLTAPTPHHLTPYTTLFPGGGPIHSTTIHPHATLSDPSTLLFLAAPKHAPLRLHSLLHPALLASYPFVSPDTERHLPCYSLLVPAGTPHHLLAGSDSQIGLFDLHRPGAAPVAVLRTTPARRAPPTPTRMKGLVSALAAAPETGVLAAGTYSRCVGLYDAWGAGECVGVFEVPRDFGGRGVTAVGWGADGRELFVSERCADVVHVYDIRGSGERVRVLRGRAAGTNSRMGVEVGVGEVRAGGVDGVVRVWGEGEEPVGAWAAAGDPVTGVGMHPGGVVVATCSGERKTFGLPPGEEDSDSGGSVRDERPWDNALKVWEVPYGPVVGPKDTVDSAGNEAAGDTGA